MKDARTWLGEHSQSGPFDLIWNTGDAIKMIKQIQTDALRSGMDDLIEWIDQSDDLICPDGLKITINEITETKE